jgi:hypothetical protein
MNALARWRERRTPKTRIERALVTVIEREARSLLPLELRANLIGLQRETTADV